MPSERYRPLPTGRHGLDPDLVERDQRERLHKAMIELTARKGYPSVRIVDLARLAHVSQPTFYALYADKEELFLSAYDEVAARTARLIAETYSAGPGDGGGDEGEDRRLVVSMRAFAELAAAEPDATSLLVLGAFGGGARALARRRQALERLERRIHASRSRHEPDEAAGAGSDFTIKMILGGVRDVTAARLREGRAGELPAIAEELAAWAACYPRRLPEGLGAPIGRRRRSTEGCTELISERSRRAEGRLPRGRSELPRELILKSQRERIVDATAMIVAEKGLAALTVPEIARRANVSHQTFYDIYASKHEAFLGTQKIGMHQALRITAEAYERRAGDWPGAVIAGLRALIDFLVSEPAHAHLSLVDTFATCPEAIEIRNSALQAFAAYLAPGYELASAESQVPAIAAEAIAGGIWQVLHHYSENDRLVELPGAAPQLGYLALTPFLGPAQARAHAVHSLV